MLAGLVLVPAMVYPARTSASLATFQSGASHPGTSADTTARYAAEAPEEFKAFLQRKQQENKQLLDFYVTEPDVSGAAVLARRGGPCSVFRGDCPSGCPLA